MKTNTLTPKLLHKKPDAVNEQELTTKTPHSRTAS